MQVVAPLTIQITKVAMNSAASVALVAVFPAVDESKPFTVNFFLTQYIS